MPLTDLIRGLLKLLSPNLVAVACAWFIVDKIQVAQKDIDFAKNGVSAQGVQNAEVKTQLERLNEKVQGIQNSHIRLVQRVDAFLDGLAKAQLTRR